MLERWALIQRPANFFDWELGLKTQRFVLGYHKIMCILYYMTVDCST